MTYRFVSVLLFILAFASLSWSLKGGGSYERLRLLQNTLATQERENLDLKNKVISLRSQTYRLLKSKRDMERVAREEHGLAGSNELVFIFE
ncbi:MAG TPA: septum formation initiator family protein [Oligoflexia bacterium]|nr:septum formation initiator family protein [Oligoflexia bacterium]HMP26373.1 septum formation initiator family protein [Oligoflexia bacterium]